MQNQNFSIGDKYTLQGTIFIVTKHLTEGQILVSNTTDQQETVHKLDELIKAWREDKLIFFLKDDNHPLGNDQNSQNLTNPLPDLKELSFLSIEDQQEVWDRYQFIKPLYDLGYRRTSVKLISQRIKEFNPSKLEFGHFRSVSLPDNANPKSHKRQKPYQWETPSVKTAQRWLKNLRAYNGNICALQPRYSKRGNRLHQIQDPVKVLILTSFKLVYDKHLSSNPKTPITHVISQVSTQIKEENKKRLITGEEELKVPSDVTIYRYINTLDPRKADLIRYGQEVTYRKNRTIHLRALPERINQEAEIDHCWADLIVVDQDSLPLGQPLITVVRDRASAYPSGVHISFEPPSYQSAMECMIFAISPKPDFKTLLGTQNAYEAWGIWESITCDNGPEFVGDDLKQACNQLPLELHNTPPRTPWLKGAIEGYIGHTKKDLLHNTPGAVMDLLKQESYNPQEYACISLDKLWQIVITWVTDVYTQEWHDNVCGVPAQIWKKAIAGGFFPRMPYSRKQLMVLLSRIEMRTLQQKGIEFEHLFYQSDALQDLRRRLIQDTKKNNPSVAFKWNPGSLSSIWVMDPYTKNYIEALITERYQAYISAGAGMSYWKHKVVRRYLRERMKQEVDLEGLIQARENLRNIMLSELRPNRAVKTRKGAARWLGYQVNELLRSANETPTDKPNLISEVHDETIKPLEEIVFAPLLIEAQTSLNKPIPQTWEQPITLETIGYSSLPQMDGVALLDSNSSPKAAKVSSKAPNKETRVTQALNHTLNSSSVTEYNTEETSDQDISVSSKSSDPNKSQPQNIAKQDKKIANFRVTYKRPRPRY